MPDGKDILRELPKALLPPMLAPMDALLDLLEESGSTFRAQADALAEASAALEQTAKLMQAQAEIYEGAIRALREPADLARRVTGAKPRQRGKKKKATGKKK